MAIFTFLDSYDLSGKTVIPFCTHNGYGGGDSYQTIARLCPSAANLEGLAVDATAVKSVLLLVLAAMKIDFET